MRYAIGTRVRVQVSRVDLDGRRIDFRLVQNGEGLGPPLGKDKVAEPSARSPKSAFQPVKAVVRPVAVKGKDKDKGRKPRRRS